MANKRSKKNKKASFEEVYKEFIRIMGQLISMPAVEEWRKRVVELGWTDEEFENELDKRRAA